MLFVCEDCQRLCLLNTGISPREFTNPVTVSLNLDSTSLDNNIITQYAPISRGLICNGCCVRLKKRIEIEIKLSNTTYGYYSTIMKTDVKSVREKKPTSFKDVANPEPILEEFIDEDLVPFITNSEKYTPRENCLCSLMLGVTFRIEFNGLCPSINGRKLGIDPSKKVTANEVDQALYLLCQLIKTIGSMIDLNTDDIVLVDKILIRDKGLSLREVSDKLDQFNEGINVIMNYCQQIFGHPAILGGKFLPAFTINLEDRTIGNCPYGLSKERSGSWTIAMRYLLQDFKLLMVSSMIECVARNR